MGDPLFDLIAGALVLILAIAALAVWRVGRVVSWAALTKTALATGSFETCVAYIRFCAQRKRSD